MTSKKNQKKTCVFCEAIKTKPSAKNLVLCRGRVAYVIMNRFPYISGHIMVIPNRHIGDYTKLTKAEHAEMGELISKSIQVLNKVYKPQGVNIGMNLGEAAGGGIKDHLHYHLVPRWNGDHNFMSVTGEARVIMEDLKKSYQRLKKEF